MPLPITQSEVDKQLSDAIKLYYDMTSNGSTADQLSNQKNIIEELTILKNSFIGNTEYTNLVSQAKGSFNTACKSLSENDIKTTFLYYKNLSSYITTNSIGINENTGSPIFGNNISNTFNNSGQKINIQGI